MTRPLSDKNVFLILAMLLIVAISYNFAMAYENGSNYTKRVTVVVCDVPQAGIDENNTPPAGLRAGAFKATLRAGVAVGKSVARTARVVVESLSIAAHHGAAALILDTRGVF